MNEVLSIFISSSSASSSAIFISLISLGISGLVLWFNFLKPAKLIGMYNVFKATSDPQKMILPCLWIQNIGAKTMFVEDIRICFQLSSGTQVRKFSIYPRLRDTSSGNEHLFLTKDENKLGAIFEGFALKREETWRNIFSFGVPVEKESCYDHFKGEWITYVQIKPKTKGWIMKMKNRITKKNWITVSGTQEKHVFKEDIFTNEKKLLKVFYPEKYSDREHFKWTF